MRCTDVHPCTRQVSLSHPLRRLGLSVHVRPPIGGQILGHSELPCNSFSTFRARLNLSFGKKAPGRPLYNAAQAY
jgi:hypothetical protein